MVESLRTDNSLPVEVRLSKEQGVDDGDSK
jgi:hypothetical protein